MWTIVWQNNYLCVGSADTVSLAFNSFVVACEGGLAGVQQLLRKIRSIKCEYRFNLVGEGRILGRGLFPESNFVNSKYVPLNPICKISHETSFLSSKILPNLTINHINTEKEKYCKYEHIKNNELSCLEY